MTCPHCHEAQESSSRYCDRCGSALLPRQEPSKSAAWGKLALRGGYVGVVLALTFSCFLPWVTISSPIGGMQLRLEPICQHLS